MFMEEIIIIFMLLFANGLFSMSETAVVSARKARLKKLSESGNPKAPLALILVEQPNAFLATVQVGISLIGIFTGVFGGATIAETLNAFLSTIPGFAPYSHALSLGIVVLGITYCSLILGELIPKRIALNNPERVVMTMAPFMRFFSKVTKPAVWLLEHSTSLVARFLQIKPSSEPAITPEELKILIEQGEEDGAFEPSEKDMIKNVLQLDEHPITAFMTPRPKIVSFDIEDSEVIILEKIKACQHSRFPVIRENLDNVLGVVRAKDLLLQSLAHKNLNLKELLKPPIFISETMSALKVLELFKEKGTHIALVTDEYGVIQGLITHNDLLEDIAGCISSVSEPKAIRRDDGSWLIDGLFDILKLKNLLNIASFPTEEQGLYHTLGGFVLSQFPSLPVAGSRFEWQQYRFEVMDMDGRRVDKVLVTPLPSQNATDSPV